MNEQKTLSPATNSSVTKYSNLFEEFGREQCRKDNVTFITPSNALRQINLFNVFNFVTKGVKWFGASVDVVYAEIKNMFWGMVLFFKGQMNKNPCTETIYLHAF